LSHLPTSSAPASRPAPRMQYGQVEQVRRDADLAPDTPRAPARDRGRGSAPRFHSRGMTSRRAPPLREAPSRSSSRARRAPLRSRPASPAARARSVLPGRPPCRSCGGGRGSAGSRRSCREVHAARLAVARAPGGPVSGDFVEPKAGDAVVAPRAVHRARQPRDFVLDPRFDFLRQRGGSFPVGRSACRWSSSGFPAACRRCPWATGTRRCARPG